MKRVESININGVVFSIDEDAFGKLRAYLDTLSKYFKQETGGYEIIADIEARIAELFSERLSEVNQVVTIADVAQAIETLGTPEDIAGTDIPTDIPPQATPREDIHISKRLYRDSDQNILGGVCAGIAARIGVNPIVIRLLFIGVAFLYGVSVPVYFILWVVIPKAVTTTQKLRMRGQPVTISNIEKNVKENLRSGPLLQESFRQFINEAGAIFQKIFNVFGRTATILLGIALFCVGIAFCVGIGSLFMMQDIVFNREVDWDLFSFNELLRYVVSPVSYNILLTCAIVVIALIVFACLYWGLKMIIRFKIKHKLAHVVLMVVLILAILTGIFVSFNEVRNYTWHNELTETITVSSSDTLYLSVNSSAQRLSNNPLDIYLDKTNNHFYGKPNLHIRKSDDGQFKMEIRKQSQGESKLAAYQYADSINYEITQDESQISLAPYFTVTPQDRWKFQMLTIVLFVPEGTIIVADKALCADRILGRRLYTHHGDCSWVMTKNKGLQPQEKPRKAAKKTRNARKG